jgi:hypothetical protein
MSEKDIKFTNFSDSPEYVDIFNDENTSLTSDNDIMLGALCATQGSCLLDGCSQQTINTGITAQHSIALGLGISINTSYINGAWGQCTSASTSTSWGRTIYAEYLGPTKYSAIQKGEICQFKQALIGATNKNCYYFTTVTAASNESEANTIENDLKTFKYEFRITSFDGHEVPYDFYLSGTGVSVLHTTGNSLNILTFPQLSKALHISAMTYNVIYTSGTTSASASDAVRNSKIGTKYTVTNVAKNKTATTVSGGSYVYSTSCVRDTNTFMLIPTNPFFIQTSAQSITINYERLGTISSGITYDLSSYSNSARLLLPIQESNYRLATIDDLSNTNGLGISAFSRMFNNATANFKNIVITPNYYDSLAAANYNTSYKYYKPALFFKAGSSNGNYCLRMNDISTFDKWMYMVGGVSNSATTYTTNSFDYKNYDSANVKNNRDWASNLSDKNAYFTLILK